MTIGKGTHRVITLDMLSSISAALTRSKNEPNTLAYIRDLIAEDGFVLNDQQANTTSRDVTKEEHEMLTAATLRSSIVIAKGRLVDPKPAIQTFPISQDSRTLTQVTCLMSINPTPAQEQELKNFMITK